MGQGESDVDEPYALLRHENAKALTQAGIKQSSDHTQIKMLAELKEHL